MKRTLVLLAALAVSSAVIAELPQEPAGTGQITQLPPRIDVNSSEIAEIEAGTRAIPVIEGVQSDTKSAIRLRIDEIVNTERADVSVLKQQFDDAPSEAAALEILHQIEQRKQETEIALMQVQLEEASSKGNSEMVTKIEAAIEKMNTPRPAGVPQDRPAPVSR